MVNIGTTGPRIFPGQLAIVTNGENVQTGVVPFNETDIVGPGYPDATPIVVPPGSSSGAVVNTTPKMFEGIEPRRNTPSGPPEQGGKVMMDQININGRLTYRPRIQFTPTEVEP